MKDIAPMELNNLDPDDISDVLVKVEKSFQLTLKTDAFTNGTNFGDLCDIISREIGLEHSNDCTTQQAFYKLRRSISAIQLIEKNTITPHSALEGLFPKKHRRNKIHQIENQLGFHLKILKPKDWICFTLPLLVIGSFITMFINWKFGLAVFALSLIASWIANRLGKEFAIKTLGEAAEKMARENYLKSRRNPKTVNQQEIVQKIKQIFIHDLYLEDVVLTRESPLF